MNFAPIVFWFFLAALGVPGSSSQTKQTIASTLHSLAPVRDYQWLNHKPWRQPIPRTESVIDVIATAASETEDPARYAMLLDVLGAHESGYNASLVGDHGNSCGAFQTPCGRTPGFRKCTDEENASNPKCARAAGRGWGWMHVSGPGVALAQARVAVSILRVAIDQCAAHPIYMYAAGACVWSKTAASYEEDVALEAPLFSSSSK